VRGEKRKGRETHHHSRHNPWGREGTDYRNIALWGAKRGHCRKKRPTGLSLICYVGGSSPWAGKQTRSEKKKLGWAGGSGEKQAAGLSRGHARDIGERREGEAYRNGVAEFASVRKGGPTLRAHLHRGRKP